MYSISRMACFLLLWTLTLVSARTTESPLKETIDQAQDTFLNAQGSIIKIHAGEVISGSLDELKIRLETLQIEIAKLILASNARSTDSESCISAMNNLTISYTIIESRLRALEREFEKHNVFESRTIILRDLIADIRSQRFLLADEKLALLGDLELIPRVVHEVYARLEDNLRLVLNFSAAISDSERCFAVLRSLNQEISVNGQNRALNLVRFAYIIEKEHLNCHSGDKGFKKDLIRQIKEAASEFFLTSMKAGNFSSSEDVRVLLDAIYDYCPKLFNFVMKRVVDGAYEVIEHKEILANIFIRCNTPQAISGISHLFWRIKEVFYESDLVIDIASKLSELRNRIDFAGLKVEEKESFDKVVASIPKCARNLFFVESICFWNKAKNVYLQAVEDQYNYDTERRRVFTSDILSTSDIPRGATWKPIKQDDDIIFRSVIYPKEFLYYANFEYNTEHRFVFSWIEGNNRDNQSAFKVQLLNEESCYLKSSRYNEYMFASDVKFEKDDKYSYVFAWRAGTAGGVDSAFAWEIKAC